MYPVHVRILEIEWLSECLAEFYMYLNDVDDNLKENIQQSSNFSAPKLPVVAKEAEPVETRGAKLIVDRLVGLSSSVAGIQLEVKSVADKPVDNAPVPTASAARSNAPIVTPKTPLQQRPLRNVPVQQLQKRPDWRR